MEASMAEAKTTHAVAAPAKVPPEIIESAAWRSASALIEEARQRRINTPDYVPVSLQGMDDVAEMLQTVIAHVFDSMDYEAHDKSLPAQLARALAAIVVDIQDPQGRDAISVPRAAAGGAS